MGPQVGGQAPLGAAVRAPRVELAQHRVRRGAQHVEALAGGLVPEGVGQVRLAHPRLADDEHVAVLAQEGAGGQVEDLLAVDARVEAEVERLQGLGRVQAAAAQAQLELLLGAPLDLVLDQPLQELGVRPLRGDRLLATDIERVQDPGQPQPLEVRGELVRLAHRAPPSSPATNSPAERTKA